MSPDIKTALQQRLGPERRGWVRTLDAAFVMLVPLGLAGALLLYPVDIDTPLLRGALYGGIACTPVVAWSLYRQTGLTRIERIAILGVVLCMSLALMIAATEAARSS